MDSAHPLRVAIVAASPRIVGGHAVQAQRLLAGWHADPAVDAWFVPIDPTPSTPFDRGSRVKYVRTVLTQLWYWPSLVHDLRRADVVHVFSASYLSFLLAPLPAILVAKLLGKPVLLNYRSGEAPDHLRRSRLARWVLGNVDMNVVPSTFLADVFASFAIHSRVIPNTIDLSVFQYRDRQPLRPRLLSTRNFEDIYNVACTLRAFRDIQAVHPDASLMLVGGGSEEMALKTLATGLGLRHVTFAGSVPPSEIHRYYSDADIYLQTPRIDNMPGSVIEAFASGLPVVSTDVGGVSAILKHGTHGLLAPDNDANAVAAHVLRLLADPDEASRLARAAYETCRRYEWATVRAGWLEAYRSLAPHHSAASVSVEAA